MESQDANDWKSFVNKNLIARRAYLDLKRVDRNISLLKKTKKKLQKKSEKHSKLLFCCLSNSISRKITVKLHEKKELLHVFENEQRRFLDARNKNELEELKL